MLNIYDKIMLSDLDLIGTIHDDQDVPEEPDSESDNDTVSLVSEKPVLGSELAMFCYL